jgi:hypothetical protein
VTKSEYIEQVNGLARLIVAGTGRRYDIGKKIWALGMTGISDDATRDMAGPLWLIWGNLTDRVDGPRGSEPGAKEAANAVMAKAANEWISVSAEDALRRHYLIHWVYDICGYERGPSIPEF